jgi:hypothetical protein
VRMKTGLLGLRYPSVVESFEHGIELSVSLIAGSLRAG